VISACALEFGGDGQVICSFKQSSK